MGGGVAMRAAAKVAGLGVFNGGLRGGENPVVRRSVASVVSSSDDLKLAIASKTNSSVDKEKPYVDDREFADELFMEPMPRLVFGGTPTIQEAKEATSCLTDALDKTYLSSNATNGQQPLLLSDVETKPYLVTKHAIQAFRLLHENAAAQNVVASIASDPNVWTAVLKNEALVDFLQTHKTNVVFPEESEASERVVFPEESSEASERVVFPEESSEASESKSASGKGFMDYMEDIKQKITVTVVDMMTSLSDTFQSFFGGSAKDEYAMNPDGTAGVSGEKTTIVLMGLAIMVIILVVLKRA